MIHEKRFDFSEETDIKASLLARLKHKYACENKSGKPASELDDEQLRMVAGGQVKNCPFGGNCTSCEKNKNGKCELT